MKSDSEIAELEYIQVQQTFLERVRTANSFWLGSCVVYYGMITSISTDTSSLTLKTSAFLYIIPFVIYSIDWSMFQLVRLRIYCDFVLEPKIGKFHSQKVVKNSTLYEILMTERWTVPIIFLFPSVPLYLLVILSQTPVGNFNSIKILDAIVIFPSLLMLIHSIYLLFLSHSKKYWRVLIKEYKNEAFQK